MNASPKHIIDALNRRYLVDHPTLAATRLETLTVDDAADILQAHPVDLLLPVWARLVPGVAALLLVRMPDEAIAKILANLAPSAAIRITGQLKDEELTRILGILPDNIAKEIQALMAHPVDTAGRLMDPKAQSFRDKATVGQALTLMREAGQGIGTELFLVDDDGRLTGRALLQDVAIADSRTKLSRLAKPLVATVQPITPQQEVAELFEGREIANLPVTDLDGRLVGVIPETALLHAAQQDATADMQTMVGASRDERALSSPFFAVRKRMPWLQINLLTAFMAAAVVGFFESTIAQFTALAVLLPVVAGQSGNAGAQALAVTMRGLALREITARQWMAVTFKEGQVGLYNGIAIAITCSLGVYFWSGSYGLVLVIASSMVLAMVAAGFAGAIVPIMLVRLGQDPAQSSSIVLTTVTDIAGFTAFLGIATLLSGLL
ncbi:MAG: magnesium transporter [Rhodospirillales bacterium]